MASLWVHINSFLIQVGTTDMKKIVILTPCLMLDNTRDINKTAMAFNFEHLKPDCYAVYDQCFTEEDRDPRYTYIANADRRMGWVPARNGLLRWFYESDYDYAFWIDANSKLSISTVNDASTIFEYLRNDKLPQVDTIFSTLGMWVSEDRRMMKMADDYFDKVHLIPAKNNKSYNWMHGLFIKNFKKYYNQEFYIDERCDVMQGTAEDVFFSRLLRRVSRAYVAPTIICNKPDSSKSCTMANGKGTYEYPPVKFDVVDGYIQELSTKNNYRHVCMSDVPQEIILDRNDYQRDKLTPYKSRSKKKPVDETGTPKKINLF